MSKIVYKLNTENVYISARQVEDTYHPDKYNWYFGHEG